MDMVLKTDKFLFGNHIMLIFIIQLIYFSNGLKERLSVVLIRLDFAFPLQFLVGCLYVAVNDEKANKKTPLLTKV